MRVKILESMALGRVVITTQLGLEGIPAKHKQEVLIADTQDEFIKNIRWVIHEESKVLALRKAARNFIEKNYDNKYIAKNVLRAFNTL